MPNYDLVKNKLVYVIHQTRDHNVAAFGCKKMAKSSFQLT